ncbi:hypothetical protein QWZ08_20615 [Ferruginibacter paludis]|uniref:hypothetical protein n=1 Tax=Ferruginibacter paludis TaxID=1310417 RepID=UPI0025B41032|nr:hypothetical protein [Ferruginibacter paludis]MDN3658067.1 hypothetical protein [Ferruginibacter paludis]
MNRTSVILLLFLTAALLIIYYPVFTAEFLYTDEANQLWDAATRLNFETSVPQGRLLTYKIFEWVFSHIHTVHQVIYARLFSFFGWMLCLPVWYYIISTLVVKNGLPKQLVLLAMVYLICMPPFIIYIGWSACMEMFIACLSALLSGFVLYQGISYNGELVEVSSKRIALSIITGVTALFIYQHCFGCFFIPFFIHFIATKKISKTIYIGFAFSLVIFIVYYLAFKYSLNVYALPASSRGAFATNPVNKLLFFFSMPLATAFHFTYIFTEKSVEGLIVYGTVLFGWLAATLITQRTKSSADNLVYLLGLIVFAMFADLPSLIVQENYSSNRTLFALDMIAFLLVAETIFSLIKKENTSNIVAGGFSILFLMNAWYNYHKQFIDPLQVEYSLLKNVITKQYQPGITSIYFICPGENAFKEKYGITPSWDEFGIPATAKIWAPEPTIKQLIFEKTGDRKIAEKMAVKSWPNKVAFESSGGILPPEGLLIDMEATLAK